MCNDFDKNAMSLFADRFGQLVEQKKKNEKISMEKLAHELDISKPTLYRWINGEVMPNPGSLSMICSYFGVPKNYFDPVINNQNKIFYDENFHELQHEKALETAKFYNLSIPFVAFLKDIPALADAVISASYVDASENSFSENVPETDSPFQFVSSSGVKIYLPMETLFCLKDIQAEIEDFALYVIQKRMKKIVPVRQISPELKAVLEDIEKDRPELEKNKYLIEQIMDAGLFVYRVNKGKIPFETVCENLCENLKTALASAHLSPSENFIIEIQSGDGDVRILKNPELKDISVTFVNG